LAACPLHGEDAGFGPASASSHVANARAAAGYREIGVREVSIKNALTIRSDESNFQATR
jgi:hypothetical protein